MKMMKKIMSERDIFPDVDNTEFHLIKTEEIISKLNKIFVYSLIWSLGAVVDQRGRKTISAFLKRLFKDSVAGERRKDKIIKLNVKEYPTMLDNTTIYEFILGDQWQWKTWKSLM